jgi:glycosyltransferase involved in cell wall biosynthesis
LCTKELVFIHIPHISIVIPTLNEEENIGRLLESIIMQDYRPIEVIIVDGGSTDDTLKVINHFIEEFSDESLVIRVLSEYGECISPANAKNIGFLNAKGKYVLFIDADYVLLEHSFISKVVDALRKSPWVSVRLIPIQGKNNLLSLAQVIQNRIWAPEGYVDERRCFRRELLGKYANPPFDPCLGVGEDANLIIRLRKLSFNPIFVDAKLGDVVPYSLRRFVKRFEWYGRTSLRFYTRTCSLSLPKAVIASLRK